MIGRSGVCSWSLQPDSPADLAAKVRETGLSAVQLALEPIRSGAWSITDVCQILADSGIEILSGMMETAGEDYSTLDTIKATGGLSPDTTWPDNIARARQNAELAAALSIQLVTLHAGFVPHAPDDPDRDVLVERIAAVAGIFAEHGVHLALETGQESAATLTALLAEFSDTAIGVNFDPANMLLYGTGDPIDAMRSLLPHIVQVHAKDAIPPTVDGTWGDEVRIGAGRVRWTEFIDMLEHAPRSIDVLYEREAGDTRSEDIRSGVRHLGAIRHG